MVNTDRPRGILTQSDREYLSMSHTELSEKFSRANISRRWSKIGERVENGIIDLPTLYRELPQPKRKDIFDSLVSFRRRPWTPQIILQESVAFLLAGFLEQTNNDFDDEQFYKDVFEGAVENTLSERSLKAGDVSVKVEIDDWAPIEALDERKDLSDIDRNTLRNMLNAGRISEVQYATAILEKESSD